MKDTRQCALNSITDQNVTLLDDKKVRKVQPFHFSQVLKEQHRRRIFWEASQFEWLKSEPHAAVRAPRMKPRPLISGYLRGNRDSGYSNRIVLEPMGRFIGDYYS